MTCLSCRLKTTVWKLRKFSLTYFGENFVKSTNTKEVNKEMIWRNNFSVRDNFWNFYTVDSVLIDDDKVHQILVLMRKAAFSTSTAMIDSSLLRKLHLHIGKSWWKCLLRKASPQCAKTKKLLTSKKYSWKQLTVKFSSRYVDFTKVLHKMARR